MTKTVEIDAEVKDAIVAEVSKSFDEKVQKMQDEHKAEVDKIKTELDTEVSKIKTEKTAAEAKTDDIEKMGKEQFLAEQLKAYVSKNTARLGELNLVAQKSLVKAGLVEKGILSAGAPTAGGSLVPNNELLSDVLSTLGNYSTVAADLRTVTLTAGSGIDVATLVQDVIVTEVGAEGGDKAVTAPVLGDGEVNVREFAGIAVITKKLLAQSAIDVYALVRDSFARAVAKKREQLALTDATSGILSKTGLGEVKSTSTTIAGVTWKEFKQVPYKVPVAAVQGGKYYLSRQALETLDTMQDSQGRDLDLLNPGADGVTGTLKNGYPYALAEELGGTNPHVVFGNMGRYGIVVRQGAEEYEVFDSGTVKDGGTEHNLIQQNKVAVRDAWHENVGFPLPGAFAKLSLKS